MVTRLETISADAPIADLVPLFRKDYIAIVMDGDQFLGIATRLDLINYFQDHPVNKPNQLGFATRCVHAGQEPDPTTGAVMMPIYTTSTYVQQSPGVHKGYDYARTKNPTRMAFERCIADLEGGSAAFAFASGLAAISTTLECLDHGSHIVAVDDLYGGSRRLFERVRKRSAGLEISQLDLTDAGAIEAAIRPEHAPHLDRDADQSAAQAGRSRARRGDRETSAASGPPPTTPSPAPMSSARSNTASTWSCIPPRNISTAIPTWSAAWRSSGDNAELRDKMTFLQNAVGAIQGPFDSFLALRGLKTLALRMERHCASALKIAAVARAPPQGEPRVLSRAREPSPARARQEADARLRRHDLGRAHGRRSTMRAASSNAASCSRWPKASAASKA